MEAALKVRGGDPGENVTARSRPTAGEKPEQGSRVPARTHHLDLKDTLALGKASMRRMLVILFCVGPLHASVQAQEATPPERWVNVDPTRLGRLVFVFESRDRVHRLVPAPQFRATYEVEGSELTLRADDASPPLRLTLRGDTLEQDGRAAYARIPVRSEADGSLGTWRPVVENGMDRYLALRADEQVVLEVGLPIKAAWSGDTLRLSSDRGPDGVFHVQRMGDMLRLRDLEGATDHFVRRPWGCFGSETFDGSASECRP